MSEIRERAKIAAKEMIRTGWGRWSDAVTDLLAELERVESQSEKYRLEMIRCGDGWEKANQRISELEAENARLKALEDKMGSGWALVEYEKARIQAARECIEIIDKYPAFLFGADAVGVKLNLSQSIKARFGLDGQRQG